MYKPLVYIGKTYENLIKVSPIALDESEKQFLDDLFIYVGNNPEELKDKEVHVLRNQSRKGIGFFTEGNNFYPDFILWAVTGEQQVVMFIEPHGISHEGPEHEKVRFHKKIKDIEDRLKDKHLRLESFIVTPTRYEQVKAQGYSRQHWDDRHVLFMDSAEYVENLMQNLLGSS